MLFLSPHKSEKYKKISLYFFIFNTLLILLCILINFIVDPFFTFKSTNNIDIKQRDFDERVQKINFLYHINNDFDSILLGNSRVTYINQNDFELEDIKLFNFAVSAMNIDEFDFAIESFIQLTKKQPKTIILGIDPFNLGGYKTTNLLQSAFNNTKKPFYKYENLLNFYNLKLSLTNLIITYEFNNNVYKRKQRFYNKKLEKGNQIQNTISNKKYISKYTNTKLSKQEIKNILIEAKNIKNKYPKSKIIVFTPPLHNVLINNIFLDTKKLNMYKFFIKTLVYDFGKVYHFMDKNDISKSYTYFQDSVHFSPFVGKLIAKRISNTAVSNNLNFGTILYKSNIDLYLQNLGKHINAI